MEQKLLMNMQRAVEILDAGELPFSEANAKKIRGSARKCARLPAYNCDLSRIPVDAKAFVSRWSRHMSDKNAPDGFETFRQFSTWHSNVKSLMEHASGERRQRDLLRDAADDWSELIGTTAGMIQHSRKGTGLQQNDLIAVTVLRNAAREHGKQPQQLTPGMIHGWMKAASQSQRAAMRQAVSTLNKLYGLKDQLDESLLPPPLGEIPMVTDRRITPELPEKIARDISEYEADLHRGEAYGGLLEGLRKPGRSKGTVKNAREAAQWFFSCMAELDLLDLSTNPDTESFATLSCIQAAYDAEVAGDFYWKPLAKTTVRKNLEGTFRFLRRFNPGLEAAQRAFFEGSYFQGWDDMTEANQEFCRRLVKSDAKKLKFFSLARLFHQKAAPMIARYEDLPYNQQSQAVNWALAAAAASVLTFLPLRADTLLNLSVEGGDAHVLLPYGKNCAGFAIPPDIVKNNRRIKTSIQRRGKTDPRLILDWWLADARPILMARLQNPDPALLLGGAGYARLNKAWRFSTASVDLYMTLHQVRHAIASILWNEPGTELNVIAALLADQPATVARKYAFFDDETHIERGMAGMSEVNAALEKGYRK
ncbi:hypothetical protein K3722_14015 [Leisingera caerulea]|uniref:Uncharacterized protein n=1 Tax=Leisingera caerulea TaxID=506591 RepID=A0ABY5WTH9_LEICA|nr:hypothetical protein [Leisingera caerulea]UWQ57622.1 hypothetical protein K3722_14015 [Leisingera caerulea]